MRTTLVGVVTSDRSAKTRRVDVERLHQHSKYKKIVRDRTVCYVHDENNDSKIGDTVEIAECRPRSKSKRWELVRIVKSVSDVASKLKREDQDDDVEMNAAVIGERLGEGSATESDSEADAEVQTAETSESISEETTEE